MQNLQISSRFALLENKAISAEDDHSTLLLCFWSWSWYLPCNGNRAQGGGILLITMNFDPTKN